jgi:ABC-type transporter Mla subunit MlaD
MAELTAAIDEAFREGQSNYAKAEAKLTRQDANRILAKSHDVLKQVSAEFRQAEVYVRQAVAGKKARDNALAGLLGRVNRVSRNAAAANERISANEARKAAYSNSFTEPDFSGDWSHLATTTDDRDVRAAYRQLEIEANNA